jgi:hypothetical protein
LNFIAISQGYIEGSTGETNHAIKADEGAEGEVKVAHDLDSFEVDLLGLLDLVEALSCLAGADDGHRTR